MKRWFTILLTLFPSFLFSQDYWHQTAFNFGGAVYAMSISFDNAVVAGKNDKVFRSADNGKNWTQIQTLPNDIQCLGRNPENGYLYAGLYYSGVYNSTDGGLTWNSAGLPGKKVNNIVVRPDSTIFAACSSPEVNSGGVYKSTDNGINWTLSLNSLYDVYGLCLDDNGNIFAGTSDLSSNGWGLLLKSTDNGTSWGVVGNYQEWGGNLKGVAVDHSGVLFIGTSAGKIYRSLNNGTNWTLVRDGFNYYNVLPILINSENEIYVCSFGGGVIKSEDSGDTWNWLDSGLTNFNIISVCFTLDEYLYAGSMNSSIFLSNQSTSITPPYAPYLISPPDNAGKIPLNALLNWNNVPRAISYSLQVSTTNTFSTLVHSVPKVLTSNYTVPNGILDNTTQYFWRVNAKDSLSTSSWSAVNCFTTTGPAIPKTLYVGTGSTGIDWPYFTMYTDSKCDIIYTADEIASSGGFAGDITRIGFNVMQRSNLYPTMNGMQIKMQHTSLSTLSGLVTSGWTTVYSGTYTIPATGWQYITLSTPFTWNGTDNILVEICYDNPNGYGGSSNIVYGSVTQDLKVYNKYMDNGAGCDLTNGQGYTHNTVYRPGISFIVIPANPPAVPILQAPSNNATDISLTPDLTWTSNPAAYKFHLQVSTSTDFLSAVVDEINLVNSVYTILGGLLTDGTAYYWRVDATNHTGSSLWSSPWKFTTIPPPVPPNIYLENINLESGSNNCYNATQVITVAGSGSTFEVKNGASAILIAGQKISYLPGTKVYLGGYMHGYITTTGEFCSVGGLAPSIVINQLNPDSVEKNWIYILDSPFIKIYPNPTTGKFTLEIIGDDLNSQVIVRIYSMIGEEVLRDKVIGSRRTEYSLEDKVQGIYIVSVLRNGKIETVKILRE